jgi:hypothetical protein
MRSRTFIFAVILAGFFGTVLSYSQQTAPATEQTEAQTVLPEAPQPQAELAWLQNQSQQQPQQPQNPPTPAQTPQTPGQNPSQTANQTQTPSQDSSSSSSSQQGSAQQDPNTVQEKSQREKAEQQIREQTSQRTLGVVPAFNVSYRNDAVPLTAGQKIRLAFRSSTDPVTFGVAFVVAAYHEANDDYGGFGWGAEGYFKRAGAAYLDAFNGTMIGNGLLPAVLRQDPRFFRMGHGSTMRRLLYAASTSFICRGDNGKWQPNISNVGGNLAAGWISNYYYPGSNTWGQTISDGLVQTATGSIGSVFQEFWPDISRRLLHRDPTRGLDAQRQQLWEQQRQEEKQRQQDQQQQDQQQKPDPQPQQEE